MSIVYLVVMPVVFSGHAQDRWQGCIGCSLRLHRFLNQPGKILWRVHRFDSLVEDFVIV